MYERDAGTSAWSEHERRRANDEARLRQRWGRLGGVAVALSPERQSTRAWAIGAVGEERVGRQLDELSGKGIRVLHDRRIPGTRANIDHLVVTTGGVWVVDSKRYTGRPEFLVRGGLFTARETRLLVGRRDKTSLVLGVQRQVDRVFAAVGDVPIYGVLCFIDANWPLIGGGFTIQGVQVLWPGKLVKQLQRDSGTVDVDAVAARLAVAFR